MSLTTRAGLLASVASFLKRSDLTADLPDLLTLAEARIARDLRLSRQLVTTTLSTVAEVGTVALPADFLEAKSVSTADGPLNVATYEQVISTRNEDIWTLPTVYCIQGGTLYLGRIPGSVQTIDLTYYSKFAALTADGDTNWLLANHPSVYLFAVLFEASPFLLEDQRAQLWDAKYGADVAALVRADKAAEYSGSGLQLNRISTHQVY